MISGLIVPVPGHCLPILNPLVTIELSHSYYIWLSPFSFLAAAGAIFHFLISFFDEIPVSKQNRPRWDAAFCGVTSGSILFAYVTQKGRLAYIASLQCYSVLSDILVKIEVCIPLESESSVLSSGNALACLSPPSKLKFAVLFCFISKGLISFSAILF